MTPGAMGAGGYLMQSMPTVLLVGVAAPLVASLGALLWIWRRRGEPGDARRTRTILGVWLPTSIGAALAFGLWRDGPIRAQDWVVPMIVAGGAADLTGAFLPRGMPGGFLRLLLRAVVLSGLLLMARPLLEREESRVGALRLVGGAMAASLLTWSALGRSVREPGGLPALLAVVGASCTSAVVLLTGNITPAIIVATLCAGVGPGLIVGLARPGFSLEGAMGSLGAGLAGVWLLCTGYSDTPPALAALCAASVLAVWAGSLLPLARLGVAWRWTIRVGLVLLPGAAAIAWALLDQPTGGY